MGLFKIFKQDKKLSAGEIIMLWWLDNKRIKHNSVPEYFEFRYGIKFNHSLKELIKNGFVDKNNQVTTLGKNVIAANQQVIERHKDPDGRHNPEHQKDLAKMAIKSLKAAGCNKFEVLPEPDACEICKSIAEKGPFNIKNAKIGVNVFPFHEGCRCAIVPSVDDLRDEDGNIGFDIE